MYKSLNLKTPIAIVGMGKTGTSILNLLAALGYKDIITFDQKTAGVNFSDPQKLLSEGKPQTLVVSPGVSLALPWIKGFSGTITSELEIAFSFLETEKVIGITGSVGKSTTTTLLGIAANSFSRAFVGGNLGTPLADYALQIFKGSTAALDWVILELSSYQLENFKNLSCLAAILTYLTPNHLERYNSYQDYVQAKMFLLDRTSSFIVLNKNGGDIKRFVPNNAKNIWVDSEEGFFSEHGLQNSRMIGKHNLDNLALAAAVANHLGWPEIAYEKMIEFHGLSHRLENIGQHQGVQFINDSKATTMDSVLMAVEASLANNPAHLHLLLGGRDKNLPWEQLQVLSQHKNLRVSYFGEYSLGAQQKVAIAGPAFSSLKLALEQLKQDVKSGDTVLLSPGGTSLDEFKSFEDRGDFFRTFVQNNF